MTAEQLDIVIPVVDGFFRRAFAGLGQKSLQQTSGGAKAGHTGKRAATNADTGCAEETLGSLARWGGFVVLKIATVHAIEQFCAAANDAGIHTGHDEGADPSVKILIKVRAHTIGTVQTSQGVIEHIRVGQTLEYVFVFLG